ncbi:hypothetical protein GEMRC1_004400 [Eukaryota sp. GEM-RC1]
MISVRDYESEANLNDIMVFLGDILSEPYSRWTYRYFVGEFPQYCILAVDSVTSRLVGCIIGRVDFDQSIGSHGYIGMVAVDPSYRNQGIAQLLIKEELNRFKADGFSDVILETEVTNPASLRVYQKYGFLREQLLPKYYLNGNDAFRLRLNMC